MTTKREISIGFLGAASVPSLAQNTVFKEATVPCIITAKEGRKLGDALQQLVSLFENKFPTVLFKHQNSTGLVALMAKKDQVALFSAVDEQVGDAGNTIDLVMTVHLSDMTIPKSSTDILNVVRDLRVRERQQDSHSPVRQINVITPQW